MDIVIPLSNYSHNGYIELKYTLRSIQKFLSGVDKIIIVGARPDWITNIVHIPMKDMQGVPFYSMNIYKKILVACREQTVSDPFMYFSDDHFLLAKFKTSNYPYHCKGPLETSLSGRGKFDAYKNVIANTIKVLLARNSTLIDFNLHSPIVYDKMLFMETVGSVDWKKFNGYLLKSLYCNLAGIKGSEYTDLKFRRPETREAIETALRNRLFFSTQDRAMNEDMVNALESRFSKPSKYEL